MFPYVSFCYLCSLSINACFTGIRVNELLAGRNRAPHEQLRHLRCASGVLDPNRLPLVPGFNRASDLVYAADPACVDTVVCAGRVLMEGGVIPGEAEIVAAARAAAASLTNGVR